MQVLRGPPGPLPQSALARSEGERRSMAGVRIPYHSSAQLVTSCGGTPQGAGRCLSGAGGAALATLTRTRPADATTRRNRCLRGTRRAGRGNRGRDGRRLRAGTATGRRRSASTMTSTKMPTTVRIHGRPGGPGAAAGRRGSRARACRRWSSWVGVLVIVSAWSAAGVDACPRNASSSSVADHRRGWRRAGDLPHR